jgi:anti-sigma factor RsiW
MSQNHFGRMPGTDNCSSPDLRIALGAFVLGALDPIEADQVQRHLLECADCRAEYRDLAAMPGLLATITETEMASGPMPPGAELLDRLLAGASARSQEPPGRTLARRPHRRRRVVQEQGRQRRRVTIGLTAAGLAAALIGALGVGGVFSGGADSGQTMNASNGPIWGSVNFQPAAWGTSIQLTMHDVPAGDDCTLIAVDKSGESAVASTWYAPKTDTAVIPGAVSMTADSIVKFEVMDKAGKTLLEFTS